LPDGDWRRLSRIDELGEELRKIEQLDENGSDCTVSKISLHGRRVIGGYAWLLAASRGVEDKLVQVPAAAS
jgi:hypothetical protein